VRIVLDTNVLVSGILSPHGPPGRTVDLITGLRVTLLFDDRILAEYREVLARPRLRIAPREAAAILDLIEHEGELVSAAPLDLELRDPDDLPFLEVAVSAVADALVTGNGRHFQPVRGEHGARIVSPAQFVAEYAKRNPGE
jgi:uncharacterized protein